MIKENKNVEKDKLQIDKAHLEVYPEILLVGSRSSAVKIYYRFMEDVVELFGANKTLVMDELQETLNLEIALAKVYLK